MVHLGWIGSHKKVVYNLGFQKDGKRYFSVTKNFILQGIVYLNGGHLV